MHKTPQNTLWRIEMLGGMVVRGRERELHRFRAHKPGALLAYLAYYPSRPHPREVLVAMLWPDAEPRAGRNSLNTAISSLRHQLEPPEIVPGTVIAADRFTVRLRVEAFTTDVAEFRDALRAAERAVEREEQRLRLRYAIDLYAGDLLPGYYEDWVVPEQGRLADLHAEAVQRLTALAERDSAAAGALRPVHAGEPLRAVLDTRTPDAAIPQQELPLPKAPDPIAANLPLPLTRFLGREDELLRLEALLAADQPRLITLSGPGGIGKTRLALETAGRIAANTAHSICFVPLAELTEGRLICFSILQALRIAALPDHDILEQAITALSRRPCLLVLDNLEQVVEETTPIVQALLSRTPGLKCLVTSRILLSMPGEQEFAVPPLPVPNGLDAPTALLECDSVRLFLDRARSAKPDFQLTAHNAAAIATLCDRLEGLPLAIELAAARAQVLPPARMVEQMERQFDFLASRRRIAEERHRTLRAAIDWSYRLLDAGERRLFAQLSVFRGGWTLEAATAMCEDHAVLDTLTQLRDASLILADHSGDDVRFNMLNLLRAFAAEQLPTREGAALFRRHAGYYADLAQEAGAQLRGARQIQAVSRMAPEHDNLRASLEWASGNQEYAIAARLAAALYRFLYHRGAWEEAQRCLETGLSATAALGADGLQLQIRMQCDLAGLHFDMGLPQEAMRHAQESLDAARSLKADGAVAEALNLIGLLELHAGATEAARQRFADVLELRSDPHGRALALHNLARLAGRDRDYGEAQRLYELALMNRRAAGDLRGEAETLGNLGAIAQYTGDESEARRLYLESLRLYRDVRYPLGIAMMLNNLGELAEAGSAPEDALPLYARAERLLRELHSRHAETPGTALRRLGASLGAERVHAAQQEAARASWEQMADTDAILPENL